MLDEIRARDKVWQLEREKHDPLGTQPARDRAWLLSRLLEAERVLKRLNKKRPCPACGAAWGRLHEIACSIVAWLESLREPTAEVQDG